MLKSFLSAMRRAVAVRSNRAIIEGMEDRTLMSVSINSAGWTVITPPAGARVIYCSSSGGNDIYNGLSSSTPVKSLARAESLLRNGTGAELLLKDGDTWSQTFGVWGLSGASSQAPLVIGSYGTGARPTIYSRISRGFSDRQDAGE